MVNRKPKPLWVQASPVYRMIRAAFTVSFFVLVASTVGLVYILVTHQTSASLAITVGVSGVLTPVLLPIGLRMEKKLKADYAV